MNGIRVRHGVTRTQDGDWFCVREVHGQRQLIGPLVDESAATAVAEALALGWRGFAAKQGIVVIDGPDAPKRRSL